MRKKTITRPNFLDVLLTIRTAPAGFAAIIQRSFDYSPDQEITCKDLLKKLEHFFELILIIRLEVHRLPLLEDSLSLLKRRKFSIENVT
jgi:hypothetical protein